MFEVDSGGDPFRPHGASSPLLGAVEESDLSLDFDVANDAKTDGENVARTTSKPKILSPRDANSSTESNRRRSADGVRRRSSDEVRKKSMRKLSDEFAPLALPSKSGQFLTRFSLV